MLSCECECHDEFGLAFILLQSWAAGCSLGRNPGQSHLAIIGILIALTYCSCSAIPSYLTVQRKCPHEGACDIDTAGTGKTSGTQQLTGRTYDDHGIISQPFASRIISSQRLQRYWSGYMGYMIEGVWDLSNLGTGLAQARFRVLGVYADQRKHCIISYRAHAKMM